MSENPNTKKSAKRRAKAAEEGAIRINVEIKSDEGAALFEKLKQSHGGPKGAMLHLINLAKGRNEPTNAELIKMLEARLK